MSNAKRAQFAFSEAEHDFLTSFLKRKLKLARRPKEKKKTEKLRRVMSTLLNRMLETHEPELNRREIKLMEQISRNHFEAVTAQVIPELMRRIDKNNEYRPRYERDLDRCNKKVAMLEALMERLQEKL